MQLDRSEHFEEIVIRAFEEYRTTEGQLSALTRNDPQYLRWYYPALRHDAAAVFFLHHFADVVNRAQPHFLPKGLSEGREVQRWLEEKFRSAHAGEPNDVTLLGDTADALKHGVLTWRRSQRTVDPDEKVLAICDEAEQDGSGARVVILSFQVGDALSGVGSSKRHPHLGGTFP